MMRRDTRLMRTVYMRLGLEGQSVRSAFIVTNVITPILSMGKLVKQGYRFEAGPAATCRKVIAV